MTQRDFIVWSTGKWASFHRRLPVLQLCKSLPSGDRVLVVDRPWDPSRVFKKQWCWPELFTTDQGLDIFTPRLPLHDHLSYRHNGLSRLNLQVLRTQMRPWLRENTQLCHWIMHPVFYPFLSVAPPDFLLYDCYDEYTETPGQPASRLIRQYEDILLRRADYTMVASDIVYQRKKDRARYLERVPNPTDLSLFYPARETGLDVPADMATLPGPRAVYIGGLKVDLDQALLLQLAAAFPKVSWVFIGRSEGADISRLSASPNIHFLGYRPIAQIPAYLKAAHFGLIPYLLNDYTSMIQPNKAVEYLAAGLGVLSSAIPGLQELFSEEICFYRNASEAVEQVKKLLAAPRLNLPKAQLVPYDWEHYLHRIQLQIDEKLGTRA